jgi:CHASE3 domain sensor protein
MRISIFWRLIISHAGILLLSGAACFYSIMQLGYLSEAARSTLDTNQRIIAYQEGLTDAFLSEVRYGGKYLIGHTEARHDQLLQFKREFVNYLELLKRLGQSESSSLSAIERLHDQYHDLFDREVTYIRTNQTYAQSRYQQERDKIVESTVGELDLLKAQLRTRLKSKLENIDQAARTARKISIATTLVLLIVGFLISLTVSRSLDGSMIQAAPAHVTGAPWIDATSVKRTNVAERVRKRLMSQAHHLTVLSESLMAARSRRSVRSKSPTLRKEN